MGKGRCSSCQHLLLPLRLKILAAAVGSGQGISGSRGQIHQGGGGSSRTCCCCYCKGCWQMLQQLQDGACTAPPSKQL
jgi:hypothetical protein